MPTGGMLWGGVASRGVASQSRRARRLGATETTGETRGVGRTIVGLVLILGAAPVFLWLIPGSKGWTVVLGGLAALGAIVAGIVLAGHWLGVFQRRRETRSSSSRDACSCW